MKIVTWNVNSLNAREDFVALYLDADSPDVLCMQELKLEDEAVPREIFESRGYHLETFGQPSWNGVAIASKTPLTEVHRGLPASDAGGGDDGQSRLIAATTAGVQIVNLYCPQGQGVDSPKFPYKLGFYRALNDWIRGRYQPDQPLIVTGDLNVARLERDVWDVARIAGKPTFHPDEHAQWDELLAFGLTDVCEPFIEPGKFSFWDYRGGDFHKNKGFRIDHFLVTSPLVPRVKDAWISRDWRKKHEGLTPSDHAPVGIEIS